MKDLLNENILEECPNCGTAKFERTLQKPTGWRNLLSLILAAVSLTHSKHHTYNYVCTDCGRQKT